MQLTQIKAVDLSRNLSVNSVDLGSSPTRSPDGKGSPSGSGRAEGEHLGGGGQHHPSVNVPLASLGTWPLGHGASFQKERLPKHPYPVLRALPGCGSTLTSWYFLLRGFCNLTEILRSAWSDCPPHHSSTPCLCCRQGCSSCSDHLHCRTSVSPPHPLYPLLSTVGVRSILHYRHCNPVCWVKTTSRSLMYNQCSTNHVLKIVW